MRLRAILNAAATAVTVAAAALFIQSGAMAQATSAAVVVPNRTLVGKVMCGYQGWFGAPGDGSGLGWRHFGDTPGHVSFDMWPDMSELGPDESYPTKFTYADGRVAALYSAYNEKTVLRHFLWMREYGIDGVFLQRFASQLAPNSDPRRLNVVDTVLDHVRKGAAEYGRVYGVMYDLSGLAAGDSARIINDWKHLVDTRELTRDDRYVRDNDKPVVVLWGIGYTGNRSPHFDDAIAIANFMKRDPVYGGNEVMIGVPYHWRTTDTSQAPFAKMQQVIDAIDIVSPWAVGSSNSVASVERNFRNVVAPDIQWCQARGKEYMPVVFPGFSWYNLRHGSQPSNAIPRLGGQFLWAQYVQAKLAGATMVYQAMFDEVDEGTAIFKVTNNPPPPAGGSQFVTYEGLPSDFYLKLVGQGTRLIRGEIGINDDSLVKNAHWTPFVPALGVVPVQASAAH